MCVCGVLSAVLVQGPRGQRPGPGSGHPAARPLGRSTRSVITKRTMIYLNNLLNTVLNVGLRAPGPPSSDALGVVLFGLLGHLGHLGLLDHQHPSTGPGTSPSRPAAVTNTPPAPA